MENIGCCAFAGQKVRRLMLPEGLRCVEPLAFMTEMDDDAEMELYIGIAAGAAITLITGQVTALELMGNMGGGVSGMFETILVTLLVSAAELSLNSVNASGLPTNACETDVAARCDGINA